jgi:thiosulfate/3-mercaptopyruvate sulfurtransferase
MGSRPLLSVAEVDEMLRGGAGPTLLDVRWELAGGALRDRYAAGHIPGARFVDLDAELAAPPGPGGRHPLPDATDFQAAMRAAGVRAERAVVVYDGGNSMAAARAWWLLRYFGHPQVAVLDGGLAAWVNAGRPLDSGDSPPSGDGDGDGDFCARPGGMAVVDATGAAVLAREGRLLDARAAERFRGEVEPIDAVAGHIPGARSRPTTHNLQRSGRFLDPSALREAFAAAGVTGADDVGAYCGSGITAAHQVLALELAGFRAALYPGSWSGWISDPSRPVATGP